MKENRLGLKEKKQLIIFAAVTFGLTILMGIFMGVSFRAGSDVSAFPVSQMMYPAAGAILALILTREEGQKLPMKFFVTFLTMTAVVILLALVGVFAPELGLTMYMVQQYVLIAGSIAAWILLLCEKKEVKDRFCLRFTGHGTGRSLLLMLLFFVIYMVRIVISYAVGGGMSEFLGLLTNPNTWIMLAAVIINFWLTFIIFFGEEYGWRYFLQPLLQKWFGLKGGVLLLGAIWGLWHLPINIFYYSPETCMQSILIQLINCISFAIFFGWGYMKSHNNIWVPIVMHFINNNMAAVVTGSADFSNKVYGWGDVLFLLILNGVIFLPFLLTKEFKNKRETQ